MENVFLIISELFLTAMAIFGLWCAYKLAQIGISRDCGVRLAVYIEKKEDIDSLENTFFEADHSSFFGRQVRYPLLMDREMLSYFWDESFSEETTERFEIYIRADELPQLFGREDSCSQG